MVFVTIPDTNDSLKTCSECRRKLAARGGVLECRAGQLQPCGGAIAADQRVEHAMRLGKDTGSVERMLGIAGRLDNALLIDLATGLDIDFGRPMLRIVGVESYIGDDLHLGGELGHLG